MIQRLTWNYLPTITGSHTYTTTPMVYGSVSPQIQSLIQSALSTHQDTLVGKAIQSKNIESTVITVPYHMIDGALSHNMVNAVSIQLAETLGCPVKLELIRLSAPYSDASILAQWLTQDLTQATFNQTIATLMTVVGPTRSAPVPGAITGIKVQLAGRITTEPSLPRTIVQSASLGSFRPSPYQSLQSSSHTVTNHKGTYTIKVWLSVQA